MLVGNNHPDEENKQLSEVPEQQNLDSGYLKNERVGVG